MSSPCWIQEPQLCAPPFAWSSCCICSCWKCWAQIFCTRRQCRAMHTRNRPTWSAAESDGQRHPKIISSAKSCARTWRNKNKRLAGYGTSTLSHEVTSIRARVSLCAHMRGLYTCDGPSSVAVSLAGWAVAAFRVAARRCSRARLFGRANCAPCRGRARPPNDQTSTSLSFFCTLTHTHSHTRAPPPARSLSAPNRVRLSTASQTAACSTRSVHRAPN